MIVRRTVNKPTAMEVRFGNRNRDPFYKKNLRKISYKTIRKLFIVL